ncbi:Pentatricopeptide repeat-containing protein [Platanthera zijinensis]|uniref:Pentatricopeptide repeat-containing protein n=1 Tax=Platanthera zijinensis TaxID=2320716 RepID=A0AAP0G6G9_9ASPA
MVCCYPERMPMFCSHCPRLHQMDFHRRFLSCTSLHSARRLHALLLISGRSADVLLTTDLINLYSRLGDLPAAAVTFNKTSRKNIFSWNSMISAFVRHGSLTDALLCFHGILAVPELRPDSFTFPVAVKSCGTLKDVEMMHSLIERLGFATDLFVAASMISGYLRSGSVDNADKVFAKMPHRDSGCWNAMISGLCQNGRPGEAIQLFSQMVKEETRVDKVTISSVLPACASLNDIIMGMSVHVHSLKHGVDFEIFVSNGLIDMYSKLGCLEDARLVFDEMEHRDLVTWNSIIAAYEQFGDSATVLEFFALMKTRGLNPDLLTLVSLASAVAQIRDHRNCRSLHGFFIRRGWDGVDVFVGNAVIDMYGKMGRAKSSRDVFDGMPVRDVVSWNTLISSCSQNGLADEAIELYERMGRHDGMRPVQGTFAGVLPACSHIGALRKGAKIHGQAIKEGLHFDVFVATCLIDMYAKCGRLVDAMNLFAGMPMRASGPWNAIIAGHGAHGEGKKALELFSEMEKDGVFPDHVTFVSLLSACSHAGLVQHGEKYFRLMKIGYGIEPMVKHYACMVDLLGRAGNLEAAYKFIQKMPLKPDSSVWGALLAACRNHGNVELGRLASDRLFEIDPENAGYYVLLSNLYAKNGEWRGVHGVRSVAEQRGLLKTPGWSSIEVNGEVNVFFTGNKSHPRSGEIYREMWILLAKMKGIGYVSDYSFVLQDVEDDEKEHILTSHSERLAIVFGIISTPAKSPLHVFKNLRVCGDCHNATKYMSRITERDIVVRDSNRFHHFKEGRCSCGDYW